MSKRVYNVFFNVHTISGIVISVVLYVLFFAGAFALFKDEIELWEIGEHLSHTPKEEIDYDGLLDAVDKQYDLRSRDIQFSFAEKSDKVRFFISEMKDTIHAKEDDGSHFFYMDIHSHKQETYAEQYNLGEFLYRLHFLGHIPYLIYIAGFVSLFFLFAIISGVIVHWKKIIPKFYDFNPLISLKRVWADAHTTLGIVGLPFQFIFALTGAYLCLNILVLLPANFLYNGDQNKLLTDLRPERKTFEWKDYSKDRVVSMNQLAKQTAEQWENFDLTRGFIKNYGGENMKFIFYGEKHSDDRFIGSGYILYNAITGKVEESKNPNEFNYISDSQRLIGRLHFGEYGGLFVKLLYFILALVTCFVIITGVLVWLEARNKKSMSIKERKYTAKVGHIYLAICLSMTPITALAFLYVKLTSNQFTNNLMSLYIFYYVTWILAILYYRFKRNNYFTNKNTLLWSAILGFLVPLTNGLVSNNWIWNTYLSGQYEILLIDLLWIGIASTCLLVYFKIAPKKALKSTFISNPIDYSKKDPVTEQISTLEPRLDNNKNELTMRTKIIMLWFFLGIGWLVHHLYGVFNIYYTDSLMMEGATGEAPLVHHFYRILFEGFCLMFALLSIEISKKWFKVVSLVWASISALYNLYHLIVSFIYESKNLSEIFMLILVLLASILLVRTLLKWVKEEEL